MPHYISVFKLAFLLILYSFQFLSLLSQNGKEIELKSTEKELPKDEKYMHEVFLFCENYVIL